MCVITCPLHAIEDANAHEADRVPRLAEEAQSEGTSGGDSRANNVRFFSWDISEADVVQRKQRPSQ